MQTENLLCILVVVCYSENSLGEFTPLTFSEITELKGKLRRTKHLAGVDFKIALNSPRKYANISSTRK